jgi:hypothetical protein
MNNNDEGCGQGCGCFVLGFLCALVLLNMGFCS